MKAILICVTLLAFGLVMIGNSSRASTNMAISTMNNIAIVAATNNAVNKRNNRVDEGIYRRAEQYKTLQALTYSFNQSNKNPCDPTLKVNMSSQVMVPCNPINKIQ